MSYNGAASQDVLGRSSRKGLHLVCVGGVRVEPAAPLTARSARWDREMRGLRGERSRGGESVRLVMVALGGAALAQPLVWAGHAILHSLRLI